MGYKNVIVTAAFKSKELENLDKDLISLNQKSDDNKINIYFWFDIAKDFHYLSIILEKDNNTKTYDIWGIKNTNTWFKNLKSIFDILSKNNIEANNIFLWMEATWSYHFSLLENLNSLKLYKNIYVINPSKIKQFFKDRNNSNVKTDQKDAKMIAEYLKIKKEYLEKDKLDKKKNINDIFNQKDNSNTIHRTQFLETSNLRFLYRQYFKEKQEEVRIKNRIKELTNRIMPEIYDVFNSHKYSKMELYIKSHFNRSEIINMKEEDFYKKVMIWSWNREWNNKKHPVKLKKLQELLRDWIWLEDDYWLLKWQMNLFVVKYYWILENIENMKNLILAELDNRNIFIPEIPKTSRLLLWVFYAEIWSHIYYKNIKELIWFIGWYPTQNMSWGKTLWRSSFQHRWNYILRKAIYLIMFNLTSKFTEVNEYKEKIRLKKDIKAKQAMIESWSKMLRIIFSLYKNKENFDLEKFKLLNNLA